MWRHRSGQQCLSLPLSWWGSCVTPRVGCGGISPVENWARRGAVVTDGRVKSAPGGARPLGEDVEDAGMCVGIFPCPWPGFAPVPQHRPQQLRPFPHPWRVNLAQPWCPAGSPFCESWEEGPDSSFHLYFVQFRECEGALPAPVASLQQRSGATPEPVPVPWHRHSRSRAGMNSWLVLSGLCWDLFPSTWAEQPQL